MWLEIIGRFIGSLRLRAGLPGKEDFNGGRDGNEIARLGCGQVRGKWVELEEPPGVELSRTWDNSSVMFAAEPCLLISQIVCTQPCVSLCVESLFHSTFLRQW